jgi:hypothetical protein
MTQPEEDSTGRSHPRFTLRALMGMILACAMILGWLRWRFRDLNDMWLNALYSWKGWLIVLPTSFALARSFGPTVRSRRGTAIICACFILVLAVSLYLVWCRFRATYGLEDHWFPRDYPFPDWALIALERWYDARRPLKTPGTFKLSGEWPRVAILMNSLANVFLAVTGFLLGLMMKPSARTSEGRSRAGRCESSEGVSNAS